LVLKTVTRVTVMLATGATTSARLLRIPRLMTWASTRSLLWWASTRRLANLSSIYAAVGSAVSPPARRLRAHVNERISDAGLNCSLTTNQFARLAASLSHSVAGDFSPARNAWATYVGPAALPTVVALLTLTAAVLDRLLLAVVATVATVAALAFVIAQLSRAAGRRGAVSDRTGTATSPPRLSARLGRNRYR
jgi:hypothetical protein